MVPASASGRENRRLTSSLPGLTPRCAAELSRPAVSSSLPFPLPLWIFDGPEGSAKSTPFCSVAGFRPNDVGGGLHKIFYNREFFNCPI
jgi:hypothetical protein